VLGERFMPGVLLTVGSRGEFFFGIFIFLIFLFFLVFWGGELDLMGFSLGGQAVFLRFSILVSRDGRKIG
jgi:hypothetical protein